MVMLKVVILRDLDFKSIQPTEPVQTHAEEHGNRRSDEKDPPAAPDA